MSIIFQKFIKLKNARFSLHRIRYYCAITIAFASTGSM